MIDWTEVFPDGNIPTAIWPMCDISSCNNRCWRGGGSKYCFPHSQDADWIKRNIKIPKKVEDLNE